MKGDHFTEVHICKIITVKNEKRLYAVNPAPVGQKGPRTPQKNGFVANGYFRLAFPPFSQEYLEFFMEPVGVDQYFVNTVLFEVFQPYLQEGFSTHRQETLWNLIGKGTQSGPQARGQQKCFH